MFSPSAVVVVAGSCEIKATETLFWFDGVAICDGAQRQLLLGPVIRTEPETHTGKTLYKTGKTKAQNMWI